LKERIKELETKPTSKNSSLPPSKDFTRQGHTKSLRTSSGKKPGGQSDHKGHHLKFTNTPNDVVHHKVEQCSHCAHNLHHLDQQIIDRQQVIDIPPIVPIVTEHVKYQVLCPHCARITTKELPITEVKSKVQYGDRLRSLVTYFNVRQVISSNRLQEMMLDVFNTSISQGTIVNIVSTAASQMSEAYSKIKEYTQQSPVVGSDETSCKISGKNNWLWAYQTPNTTFLYTHATRGFEAINSQFPDGLKKSILVTDRWSAQLKTETKGKQLCLQHLIRDAQKLIETYKSKWAKKLQKTLYEIIELAHLNKIQTKSKDQIKNILDQLLSSPLTKANTKIKTLQQSLVNNKDALMLCLYNRKVPPTNNSTEQSIRKMKIKMKIAGTFRSQSGAQAYSIIQSIIDTAIKQNVKPLDAIVNSSLLAF
jgi:transposase